MTDGFGRPEPFGQPEAGFDSTPPPQRNALAEALRRLTPGLLLVLGSGVVLLGLLGFAWLQIPDSHAWEFALSIMSAAMLTVAKLSLWGWVFTRLRRTPLLWHRTLWLFVFAALGYLMFLPIATGREHEGLYAGYWVSKLPASGRAFLFTYERLVRWQDHLYDFAQWVAFALLIPLVIETVARGFSGRSLGNAFRVYGRWLFWAVTLLFGWAAFALTRALANWMPWHGLRGEALSVVLRFGAAFVADLFLVTFVLSLTAVYLDRAAARHSEPDL
jgi:hypothetical protein